MAVDRRRHELRDIESLLLSTLSASIVSIGDALGQFDRTNLLRVVRSDGVIVKPDDSITPLDSTYIAQANSRGSPLLATAHTRHEESVTSYVFAFAQTAEQRTATFLPSALGYKGPVYAYNYFDKRGMYVEPWEAVEFVVLDSGAYWIVVPGGVRRGFPGRCRQVRVERQESRRTHPGYRYSGGARRVFRGRKADTSVRIFTRATRYPGDESSCRKPGL
jgi:hypothetical protein